ncbi:MAG: O-antigen ligase family protein [Deltaproteobacteria bacterium]|nr:O-antigen ligase family protein [Deltaproteobacteria bacterium]
MTLKHTPWVFWGLVIYSISTLISMAAMNIGAGIFLISCVLESGGVLCFWNHLKTLFFHKEIKVFIVASTLLIGVCFLSLVCAKFFPLTIAGKQAQIHFLRDMAKIWYLFWPVVLLAGLNFLKPHERSRLFQIWIFAFLVISIIGVIQYYTGWPREQPIPGNPGRFHVKGFFGHHLSFANIFIFPFFITLDFLLKSFQEKAPLRKKAFYTLAALVGFFALLGTYSRMLWVALPIGLIIWAIWSLPKKHALVFAIGVVLGIFLAFQHPKIKSRLFDALGVSPRIDLWQANMHLFKQRPITGVGWHHNEELASYYLQEKSKTTSVFAGHAHNNFIEVLSSTGVLGLGVWIFWCSLAFYWLFFVIKHGLGMPFSQGLFCAWIVFHVNGLTQMNFWEGKVLHQIMWMMALILYYVTQKKTKNYN